MPVHGPDGSGPRPALTPAESFRVLRVIWLAFVIAVACLMFATVVAVTFGGMDLRVVPASVARPVILGLVVYMLLVATVMRRRLVEAIPAGLGGTARLERYQTVTIAALALIEVGGFGSAVVGLLADGPEWIVAGCLACVIVLLLARPRREEALGGGATRA